MPEAWLREADLPAPPDTSTALADNGYSLAQRGLIGGGGPGVTILEEGARATAGRECARDVDCRACYLGHNCTGACVGGLCTV